MGRRQSMKALVKGLEKGDYQPTAASGLCLVSMCFATTRSEKARPQPQQRVEGMQRVKANGPSLRTAEKNEKWTRASDNRLSV
eukprot:scaffold399567_cov20-Prasinocladus_malaysianus.AAC.1